MRAGTEVACITVIQDAIVREFGDCEDWFELYGRLLEASRQVPADPELGPEHLLPGCQSQLWLKGWCTDGCMRFSADCDARLTKGILALLLRTLDGQRPTVVAETQLFFIDRIGLRDHLSPVRSNGLAELVRAMRALAMDHAGAAMANACSRTQNARR
ncbi:MAG: SufE family protein [Planctomycetota bacterium]